MLALEISFLTGRYVATEYNDRSRAEWPPHPARVFSALVAAHANDPAPEEREALLWLERQPPPEIAVSPASEREVTTVFVPVNDRPGVEDGRIRQPRTFPSRTPDDPRVVIVWPVADAGADRAAALDRLCSKVVRIGHSSSLASLRIVNEAPRTTWRPSENGHTWLRVVRDGQLTALDRAFELHREMESGRVMPAAFQLYTDREQVPREDAPSSLFGRDWLIFRQVGTTPRLPAIAGPRIAGTVRRALMRFAEQPTPEIVSGHGEADRPSTKPHLAIVPLPFVGNEHADGRLMGFALVLPREIADANRAVVYQAVASWENDSQHARARQIDLHAGRLGSISFERLEDDPGPVTLQAATWSAPSRTWVSATPIALDRNPGDLHSRDQRISLRAYGEAEETVQTACERIGLPRPEAVTILPAAPIAGAAKVRAYGGYPSQPGKTRRVLTHARIVFNVRVRGPVMIGAGRYAGLGLLRPMED